MTNSKRLTPPLSFEIQISPPNKLQSSMNQNYQKATNHSRRQDQLREQQYHYEHDLPSPDSETYIKDYKPKPSSAMLRSLHSTTQPHEKEPYLSQPKTNKMLNLNYGSNTMSRLKSELRNLKLDFSEFFSEEQSKAHGESFLKSKRSITAQSPKDIMEDQFDHPKHHSSKLISHVEYIEEENADLKNELKRWKNKYQTKKSEYKEIISFLNKKIEYLEEQLANNEDSMMEVKSELEQEMDLIREQLTRKRDAEITLDDYGEMIEINNGLKAQILSHQEAVEELKEKVEASRKLSLQSAKTQSNLKRQLERSEEKGKQLVRVVEQRERVHRDLQSTICSQRTMIESLSAHLEASKNENLMKLSSTQEMIEQIAILRQKWKEINSQKQEIGMQFNLALQELDAAKNHIRNLEQHMMCEASNYQNQSLNKDEVIYRQSGEIEHLVAVIRELEGIGERQEQDRQAMLCDIEYLKGDLNQIRDENEQLKRVVSEKDQETPATEFRSNNTAVYKQRSPKREPTQFLRDSNEIQVLGPFDPPSRDMPISALQLHQQ